ncbi:unnamed protein product [Anisakis simplex]|uniref:Uncharacterized protein n=1 Tax=Anisakis simplex TaxID=6269 RepID=A0A0M3J4H3_ANISI|nr:unnamed protein product [Anisakis simplex]
MCIQHPILSLYPPGAQPDSNDEFAYDIGDKKGDSIVSPCQNHYTESLYQLLQLRREIAAEEMPSENNDPAVLEGENDNEN